MNIYVGNLSFDVSEQDLRQAFEAFGQVTSANVITVRFAGVQGIRVRRDVGQRTGAGRHRGDERQGDQGPCVERE